MVIWIVGGVECNTVETRLVIPSEGDVVAQKVGFEATTVVGIDVGTWIPCLALHVADGHTVEDEDGAIGIGGYETELELVGGYFSQTWLRRRRVASQ